MLKLNPIVIYHRSDYDGIFCREIAKKFIPDAELIGWEYGDECPEVKANQDLYILDLSIEPLMSHPRLIWIDHHKTAIDKYPPHIPGYRIDGVAACRLAWQWFNLKLPSKEDYINRKVSEPLAVKLAGEYDIWDKRDPNAELFQHGLRSQELTEVEWKVLLDVEQLNFVEKLLEQGKVLQYAKEKENASIIKAAGFNLSFEGRVFLACNHARFNSFLFTAGVKEFHEGLLGFCWDGDKWKISMYHAPHRTDIDLSEIAIKYKGGGHRGACGFTCAELPFKLSNLDFPSVLEGDSKKQ